MSWNIHRAHLLKGALLISWIACILGVYSFLQVQDIPVSALPAIVKKHAIAAGMLGPVVIVLMYIFQTIIPFPTAALAVLSGALYGPWVGIAITVIGTNVSGSVSFFMGRFFGRHFVTEYERGWIKQYDDILAKEGFTATLFMRLLFFPFDIVSALVGLSRITFRQYAVGTFLGTIPSIVVFVVLGRAFHDPRGWVLFGVLVSIVLAIVYMLRRSEWSKKKLFVQKEPQLFE